MQSINKKKERKKNRITITSISILHVTQIIWNRFGFKSVYSFFEKSKSGLERSLLWARICFESDEVNLHFQLLRSFVNTNCYYIARKLLRQFQT
jgi:hypothetical protein